MDKKSYKKFNICLISAFLTVLLGVAALNVAVNPYNIFPFCGIAKYKPEAKLQERVTKLIGFKLDKRKINSVFLGNSRTDYSIDRDYFKKVTGLEAENLAMGGIVIEEYPELLDLIFKIHPEVKNIFLGTDFIMFSGSSVFDEKSKATFEKNPNLTTTELCTALFSFSSTRDSVWTLVRNLLKIKGGAVYNLNGTRHPVPDKRYREIFGMSVLEYVIKYKNFDYNPGKLEIIRKIKAVCDERGVGLHLFVMPTHLADMYLISSFPNTKNAYYEWKKDLTQIAPVYDFQYPSDFMNESISDDMQYFFDISHVTPTVGNMIIDFFDSGNSEIGRFETSEYIDLINRTDSCELAVSILEDPELKNFVDKIKGGENAI